MQKKLIALALAALAPAAAMADDSNVTVYGLIDYGYAVRSGSDNNSNQTADRKGTLGEFAGGISAGNRIGFKGAEDLGNGLKAIFEIEFGFKGDDTAGTTFNKNRHSWVGLTGGFGTLLGGRVDGARYSFTGKYDPFKNQTVANAGSLFGYTSGLGQADRADNALVYITPELFPGFKVLGAYTKSLLSQEGTGLGPNAGPFRSITIPGATGAANNQNISNGNTPLYAVAALYDQGPISATLDYEHLNIYDYTNSFLGNIAFNIYVAGASYDFGPAKVSAYYEYTKGRDGNANVGDDIKGQGWLLGVTVPLGSWTLMASYVDARDKSHINSLGLVNAAATGVANSAGENDCKKFGIGAEYAFSKRTSLYTTYARIKADDAARCGITYAASSNADAGVAGNASSGNAGYGKSGFDLGIRHAF